MLLISPSAEFVARLPNRKIPDRRDFISYSAEDRVRVWHKVVDACKWLADDFESVMEHGQMAARLETFSK
jgi:hypothetical protein